MGVVLHRTPQQVLATRLAVDAAGALRRSDLVEVAEQNGHRAIDVLEVRLVIVTRAVALHLVAPDPARELLDDPARFLLAALAEQPAELLRRHARRVEQRPEMARHQFVAPQVPGSGDARQLPEEQIDRQRQPVGLVGQDQVAIANDHLLARWQQVDAVGLHRHAVFRVADKRITRPEGACGHLRRARVHPVGFHAHRPHGRIRLPVLLEVFFEPQLAFSPAVR